MHLKLRSLEMFRLFAQIENVTETARLMNISQPAVSQALKELEEAIGVALFKRSGRQLRLTHEARLLLPEVDRLIMQMATIHSHALSLRSGDTGSLTISCIPTLAHSLLPPVVASFRAQRPNVRLRIGSYPATEIAHRIRRETADLGITFLPINDADLSVEPLLRTALTCLVSTASPLAREPVITPDHLKDECVIAQGSETPPGFVLHNYLERANLTGWPTVEVNQSTISLALAERQIGIAISHPLVLSTVSTGTVTAVPFEPQIPLTLALIYPREHERSKQVTEFVAILRQKLSEILTELKARRLPSELL